MENLTKEQYDDLYGWEDNLVKLLEQQRNELKEQLKSLNEEIRFHRGAIKLRKERHVKISDGS